MPKKSQDIHESESLLSGKEIKDLMKIIYRKIQYIQKPKLKR